MLFRSSRLTSQQRFFSADPAETWKSLARAHMAAGAGSGRKHVTVRVTLGFVLLCAAIGLSFGIAGSFVTLAAMSSVLLTHELPRAFLARALGRPSMVVLSATSVHTEIAGAPLRGGARFAFQCIGSIFNFVMAAAALALRRRGVEGAGALLLDGFALSHFVWGLAQVLPSLPFRTGRAIASRLGPLDRLVHAGGSVCFLFVVTCLAGRTQLTALTPVLMLVNFAAAAALGDAARERRDAHSGARAEAERAELKLRDGDTTAAIKCAEGVLDRARSTSLRQRMWTTLAWAAIDRQNARLARQAISELPGHGIDFRLVAAYLACCDRGEEAELLLCEARAFGHCDREATKQLIDLLFRRGNISTAWTLARNSKDVLTADDWQAIEAAIPGAARAAS